MSCPLPCMPYDSSGNRGLDSHEWHQAAVAHPIQRWAATSELKNAMCRMLESVIHLQGTLLAMDMHGRKLRALHRAARKCGVGPMLLIAPGTVQDFAQGLVAVDLDNPQSQPPWGPGPAVGPETGGGGAEEGGVVGGFSSLGSQPWGGSAGETGGPRWQGGSEVVDGGGERWEGSEAVDAYEPDDLEAAMSTAAPSGAFSGSGLAPVDFSSICKEEDDLVGQYFENWEGGGCNLAN